MSAEESARDALFWDSELPRPLAAHVFPGEVVKELLLHALCCPGCCSCHRAVPCHSCCCQQGGVPVPLHLHACERAYLMHAMLIIIV